MGVEKHVPRFLGHAPGWEKNVFLHFEVCSYAQVEDCIRRGIRVFEAGSGGAHHKYPRGFSPALTHSAHMHFHRGFMAAIEDFCAREALAIQSEAAALEHQMFAR